MHSPDKPDHELTADELRRELEALGDTVDDFEGYGRYWMHDQVLSDSHHAACKRYKELQAMLDAMTRPAIERRMIDVVRDSFPPPLDELYFQELERHDAALRTIPTLYTTGLQQSYQRAIRRALEATDPENLEAGFMVHAELSDAAGGEDEALRRALEAEHARHREAVADLERRAGR